MQGKKLQDLPVMVGQWHKFHDNSHEFILPHLSFTGPNSPHNFAADLSTITAISWLPPVFQQIFFTWAILHRASPFLPACLFLSRYHIFLLEFFFSGRRIFEG